MRRLRALFRFLSRWVVRPARRATADLLSLATALVAGAGVFLVVAGLFYYLQPASVAATASPTLPPASFSLAPISFQPHATARPSAGASAAPSVATRIVIPALSIDMPIIASPPNEEFPLCNVAEYMILDKPLGYPGLPQATYLYAHARVNMFLPLLTQAKINNGDGMIGDYVEVFTADNKRHIYEISQVIRHVNDTAAAFDKPLAAKSDQLWLQTSEGPIGYPYKMQVVASPVGVVAATNPADAHPTGKGNVCPKAPKCKTANGVGCTP